MMETKGNPHENLPPAETLKMTAEAYDDSIVRIEDFQ
jgi:hypothetical protein